MIDQSTIEFARWVLNTAIIGIIIIAFFIFIHYTRKFLDYITGDKDEPAEQPEKEVKTEKKIKLPS